MSKETKEEKFNNDMIAQAVNMVTKSDNHIYMRQVVFDLARA